MHFPAVNFCYTAAPSPRTFLNTQAKGTAMGSDDFSQILLVQHTQFAFGTANSDIIPEVPSQERAAPVILALMSERKQMRIQLPGRQAWKTPRKSNIQHLTSRSYSCKAFFFTYSPLTLYRQKSQIQLASI